VSAFPFDDPEPARSLYAYAPVLHVRDWASDWVVNRSRRAGIDVLAAYDPSRYPL
jgi:hypothetical protein